MGIPTQPPIIDQLHNVHQRGAWYRAACPICARDKQRPRDSALSIHVDTGACKCHRCGADTQAIKAELGIGGQRWIRPNAPATTATIAPSLWNHRRDRHSIAQYEFATVEGVRVQHVKFAKSDRYSPWSWRHMRNGSWHNGMGGNTPLLFNDRDVAKFDTVILCEGEKDAERTKSEFRKAGYAHGFAFTTAHTTGGQLRAHHLNQLRGKVVYIIYDNDAAGLKASRERFTQLSSDADIVAHLVRLPILKDGGDLSDYFDDGGTVDGLLAEMGLANTPDIQDIYERSAGHTCDRNVDGFTATVYAYQTTIARWNPDKWRHCPACFENRVTRELRCIQSELADGERLHYATMTQRQWVKIRDQLRKRIKRNGLPALRARTFPIENGQIVIVANHAIGEPLPADDLALRALLNVWCMTPVGKRMSGTRNGWGGEHTGTRGDSRAAAVDRRQRDRAELYRLVETVIQDVTPDATQANVVNMTAASIKRLLGLASDAERLSWLFYEYSQGKKRKTVLRAILDSLGAIAGDSSLAVVIRGYGRVKVAAELGCELDRYGAGAVLVKRDAAIETIIRACDRFFVTDNAHLSHLLHIEEPEKTVCNKADTPPQATAPIAPQLLQFARLE